MLMPSETPQQKVEISESVLLCLYEAVHLNRNFITVLTHVCADCVGLKLSMLTWYTSQPCPQSLSLVCEKRLGRLGMGLIVHYLIEECITTS